MRYLIDCKHYSTDRCNKPNSTCVFTSFIDTIGLGRVREPWGLGCKNIKLDWVKIITLRQHITNIREDRGY